jgi:hypothetical protein
MRRQLSGKQYLVLLPILTRQDLVKKFVNCAKYGLDSVQEMDPDQNRNFSKADWNRKKSLRIHNTAVITDP